MWMKYGIELEEIDYKTMEAGAAGYPLRPEIVELTYYLYHYTGDSQYLRMGQSLFDNFVRYCKTSEGYAALKDVITKEQSDSMQSFLFAETFKYFYLLFAPPQTLRFKGEFFNTEAHPIRKHGSRSVFSS
jgi:mannosidase alpha-like ER degradation enhancer 2